jgi:hypothetical protein
MTTMLSSLATIVLVALCVWVLGRTLLRLAGVLLLAGGLLQTAATGSPTAQLAARRVFLKVLPSRLDPTKRWGSPNVPPTGGRNPPFTAGVPPSSGAFPRSRTRPIASPPGEETRPKPSTNPQRKGREKDVDHKDAPPAPPHGHFGQAAKPAWLTDKPRMARLGIEPRTPRFSATRKRCRERRKSPANPRVVGWTLGASIPVVRYGSALVKDVAEASRPLQRLTSKACSRRGPKR